jgi:cellulose synthase (UDP-forming)
MHFLYYAQHIVIIGEYFFMPVNNKRELQIATLCFALTICCFLGVFSFLGNKAYYAYVNKNTHLMLETGLFSVAIFFMAYGTFLYEICLIGYYKRRILHNPASQGELEKLYSTKAPSLSVLVPSYKEERNVILQTLLSAALSEYPHKNVVLLIDDPYHPRALEDMLKLDDTRSIPVQLQKLFDAPLKHYTQEVRMFQARAAEGNFSSDIELNRLARLYEDVAHWLEMRAKDFVDGRSVDMLPYADRFFLDIVINELTRSHLARAETLRQKIITSEPTSIQFITNQYQRLIGLFNVKFSSFERKKYINLSHEANKAMNLNSYMGLIGKSWKEVECKDGIELQEVSANLADFIIPAADYVNTIDADSLMKPDYLIRLVHMMQKPENNRLAVVQSPCSSFPGCPNLLERIAGACIDVQFLTHQGYTHWGATFWVGANAMLRYRALEDIREVREENGYDVSIYIQDRTVIEDTESTIDLVHKGWELYNYPERMTFSATPPDFGSLLIQRRRWANGGMIILPKLFSYIASAPKNLNLVKEFFMRFHYLASTTTSCMVALVLFLYPFGNDMATSWLTLSALPFLYLVARDLKNAGHKYSDVFRVYALNLMLLPIIIGGVLKSCQQMITGEKIPFGRTPKITGRTAAPALYCLLEIAIPMTIFGFAANDIYDHQWGQAFFTALNGMFFVYALIHFMGVKATAQDLVAGIMTRWRTAHHHAEILPMPGMQHMLEPSLQSKRA